MIYKLVLKNTFLLFLFAIVSCGNCKKKIEEREKTKDSTVVTLKNTSNPQEKNIKTGADNHETYLTILKDKKIGIVTNQTGILSNKTHLVDFLMEKKIKLQKIYAP